MGEYFLHLWGEMCPVPLLKAEKKLKELTAQDILVLESDHSCTARTIQTWAGKKGYRVSVDEVANGIWQIRIQKQEA
ncbi:MAG: sulfurtransferase TusA family protein [Thermincolia bacterium]